MSPEQDLTDGDSGPVRPFRAEKWASGALAPLANRLRRLWRCSDPVSSENPIRDSTPLFRQRELPRPLGVVLCPNCGAVYMAMEPCPADTAEMAEMAACEREASWRLAIECPDHPYYLTVGF